MAIAIMTATKMGRRAKPGSEPSRGDLRWKLIEARKTLAWNRATTAELTNTGESTVGAYEAGTRGIPQTYVERFSAASHIPFDWFYDGRPTPVVRNADNGTKNNTSLHPGKSNVTLHKDRTPALQINLVPYWGAVPAGNWESPPDDPGWIQVSEGIADTNNVIAVRVTGSSMEPRLLHGQLVCIRLSKELRDGVVTLVKNQNSELTLKVAKRTEGAGWELHSINPEYPPTSAEYVEAVGYAISLEEVNLHGIRP